MLRLHILEKILGKVEISKKKKKSRIKLSCLQKDALWKMKNETPHFCFWGCFMEFWLCYTDKALVKCFSLSSTYLVLCKASLQELEIYAEHQFIWEHKKLPKDVLLREDSCACPFSFESCVWSSWWHQLPQMPPGVCKYLYAPKYGLIGPERSRIGWVQMPPLSVPAGGASPGFLHKCWETGPVNTVFHLHTSAGMNSGM